MSPLSVARPGRPGDGPLFTLAWYAVVLVVVFTTAFWVGRWAEPTTGPERPPVAPHAPMQGH